MNIRLNLKNKFIIMVVVFATLISGAALLLSSRTIADMVDESYRSRANEIAATVARVVDPEATEKLTDEVMAIYNATQDKVGSDDWGSPAFEAYIAKYEHLRNTDEFKLILKQLRSLQEVNDVDCLYFMAVDYEGKKCIYVIDAALEDECPPGTIDPLYEINYGVIEDHSLGFPAYITNTDEYGWLVSATSPIYNSAGKVLCYAGVDISMDVIRAKQNGFTLTMAIALLGMTVLICLITIAMINSRVVNPINQLSETALKYRKFNELRGNSFEKLKIDTGDEIETLHKSMIQMEKDIDNYIQNLIETRQQLTTSKKEAAVMNELAHKDSLTGIRNKLAYDQEEAKLRKEFKQGKRDFGLAIVDLNDLKGINDTYGHEYGNIALKNISQLICEVFLHSPVFRIGGDEFAIILKNNDYDKIETLVAEFNERLAKQDEQNQEPWERVKGAIGYALYDPELDSSVDDVFRRADQDMYQKKKAMKGENVR